MESGNFRTWLGLGERIRIWWIQGAATHAQSISDKEYEEVAEHLTSVTPDVDRTFSRAAHRAGFRATIATAVGGFIVSRG